MATPHLRHQLHLHGAKIMRLGLLALALMTLPLGAQAQKKSRTSASRNRKGVVKSVTTDNLVGYDDRWLHLGLYVAPNFSGYKIEQSEATYPPRGSRKTPEVSSNSLVSPGFSVGFMGDLRLGQYGALNFAPGVNFLTRRIEFKKYNFEPNPLEYPNGVQNQEIGSTQLDFPLLLKLKSQRRRNTRVYLIGGVKPTINIGGLRRNTDTKLEAANTDIAIEYGVGLDLFYPFFKFSPELRFSHGLTNLYVPSSNDVYSRILQSMKSHTVTLYLNIWSGR